MAIYQQDVDAVKQYLWQEETVQVTATQRKNQLVGGAMINPTTIVATDKRVIILNRETLGMRKDVESIPYNRIASVRLEKGLISCSVFLRVGGYESPGEQGFMKPGEQEGEIPGLMKNDGQALSDFINKMISGVGPSAASMQSQPSAKGAYAFCSKCGAKNVLGAKFCSACGNKMG